LTPADIQFGRLVESVAKVLMRPTEFAVMQALGFRALSSADGAVGVSAVGRYEVVPFAGQRRLL